MTYDAEVILKLVVGENLNSYKTTGSLSFEYDDFKLDYIPDKRLTIRKGHHSSVFFDIKQYYMGSLADAYQNNIGSLPVDYLQIKEKRSSFSKRSYRRNPNKVRKYCIDDCIYTKQLAEHWIKLFHEAFSFYPARWISSGYLAEKVLINNQINIPKFDSIQNHIITFIRKNRLYESGVENKQCGTGIHSMKIGQTAYAFNGEPFDLKSVYCSDLKCFLENLDSESVKKFLESINVKKYKIASRTCLFADPYSLETLESEARTKKPVIISMGMGGNKKKIEKIFSKNNSDKSLLNFFLNFLGGILTCVGTTGASIATSQRFSESE